MLSILCSNKRKKRSSCSTFCSVVIGETVIRECFGGGSFSFAAFVPIQRFMRVCFFLFLQVFVLVVQLFSPPGGVVRSRVPLFIFTRLSLSFSFRACIDVSPVQMCKGFPTTKPPPSKRVPRLCWHHHSPTN